MVFWDNSVVEYTCHVFIQRETVDIQGCGIELEIIRIRPSLRRTASVDQVQSLHRVVEIGKVDGSISLRGWLVLYLCD